MKKNTSHSTNDIVTAKPGATTFGRMNQGETMNTPAPDNTQWQGSRARTFFTPGIFLLS